MNKIGTVNGTDIWSWADELEDNTLQQAKNVASLPFIFKHVAIMADGHMGYGMPIGGVMATDNVISPFSVGNDIGCGMRATRTSIKVEEATTEKLSKVCDKIRELIPMGEGKVHKDAQTWNGFDYINSDKHPWIRDWLSGVKESWIMRSLGTLGGGNHFLEIQAGDDGNVWIMLHSGSRNLGSLICSYYHGQALENCNRWYSILPDKNLAFLPLDTHLGCHYIQDMEFALDYARRSRKLMMQTMEQSMIHAFGHTWFDKHIDVHHNFAAQENHLGKNVWVHRKGAIQARKGKKGIIPGSQGSNSYIVEGLGNVMSFKSCSHGAGRKMGRNDACKRLDIKEEDEKMKGIVFGGWGSKTLKVDGVKTSMTNLEEAPGSYKDIEQVMLNQQDLVTPLVKLKPLAVVKGGQI